MALPKRKICSSSFLAKILKSSGRAAPIAGISKTLYTSNQLPGVPRQTDVRKGVQYNFGLTGSLVMPDPTTVKQGVGLNNTVGSAILTAQDMFDVLTQNIVQTGSIGETLDNVSTVQTVAAIVSAFKV